MNSNEIFFLVVIFLNLQSEFRFQRTIPRKLDEVI